MTLLPPHPDRPEDAPLHENVRWLASTLGEVIRSMEGEQCFNAVEHLRTACRARRREKPGDAPGIDDLLAYVDALPLEIAARVSRAFTLFFLLIKTAEQVHRVRRRRAHMNNPGEPPQPASFRWTMEKLRADGYRASRVAEALARMEARPVLTAHPTEATRSTILALGSRVADYLLARDNAPPAERTSIEEALRAEVELLWLTAEVRRDRPSVMDEVSGVLWYLENRFMPAAAWAVEGLKHAFRDVFGVELAFSHPESPRPPLGIGSWVGGDRDGNPYVTPEITLETVRRSSEAIIRAYRREIRSLIGPLSLSLAVKPVPRALMKSLERDRAQLPRSWEFNRRHNAEEPVRMKLDFILGRLDANLERLAACCGDPLRGAGSHDAEDGHGGAYPDAAALESDLLLVRDALASTGAVHALHTLLEPLLAQVRIFGFHGYVLDVREDAKVHAEAVDDLARAVGQGPLDHAALRRELLGRRPLLGSRLPLADRTWKTIGAFRAIRQAQREIGPRTISAYIVSMAKSPEDLLRVLLLGRETGLVDLASDPPVSSLDVAPLFETYDDLNRAPEVMRSLFADPAYQRQMRARGMRQEVMVGYSDSAKDVGLLPASWALFSAQENLLRECDAAGIRLTLFHGRGGTVGRGGGSPVFRGLMALPPGTVDGRIKITEQGELISQKFGLLPIAERSLEVLISGTLLLTLGDRDGSGPGGNGAGNSAKDDTENHSGGGTDSENRADSQPRSTCCSEPDMREFREVMDRLSALALPVYRGLVHEDDRLFQLFLAATPARELAHVHFGSRPAYREGGAGSMKGIRAIPWVFGWTQIRLNVPSWLGVGTALSTVAKEPGGLDVLRRMAAGWRFFDDLLGKLEMVCAKTDLEVARAYVRTLGSAHMALLDDLEAEYRRTVDTILEIRRAPYLLVGQPLLQTALVHRDLYIDPLSIVQVSLLRRKQARAPDDPKKDLLDSAIGTTLNGIAQGLRSTG